MLKVVESFNTAKLRRRVSTSPPARADHSWASLLRQRIGARAEAAHDALNGANTFYLPSRSHAARVAIKKLRYSTEIAEATGLWRPPHLGRDLRRAQALLGEIHDQQVLAERLEREKSRDAARVQEIDWLLDLIRSDIDSGHARFLEMVPRLCQAAEASARWASGSSKRRRLTGAAPAMAALAFLVPSLVAIARERRRAAASPRSDAPDCVAPMAPAM
jgi:hypothetical protein